MSSVCAPKRLQTKVLKGHLGTWVRPSILFVKILMPKTENSVILNSKIDVVVQVRAWCTVSPIILLTLQSKYVSPSVRQLCEVYHHTRLVTTDSGSLVSRPGKLCLFLTATE